MLFRSFSEEFFQENKITTAHVDDRCVYSFAECSSMSMNSGSSPSSEQVCVRYTFCGKTLVVCLIWLQNVYVWTVHIVIKYVVYPGHLKMLHVHFGTVKNIAIQCAVTLLAKLHVPLSLSFLE